MSLLNHFAELRSRLLYSVYAYCISFGLCYYFVEEIYLFIAKPLLNITGSKIIYTAIAETFFTYIELAATAALAVSLPFFMAQIYLFSAPGLYKKEKILMLFSFCGFALLFVCGTVVLYYFILPNALVFLTSYQNSSIMPMMLHAKVSEYVATILHMIIGFGLAFQLPLVLALMVKFGLLTVERLRKSRRFSIVIIFTVAAVVTPPDVMSQIILATIMMVFYEATILLCAFIAPSKVADFVSNPSEIILVEGDISSNNLKN